MAGIGNIYSDEILFQARLNPGAKTAGLDRNTVSNLFASIRKTLNMAIRCMPALNMASKTCCKPFSFTSGTAAATVPIAMPLSRL